MDKADSDEALFALMDRAVPLSPVARWPRVLASGVVERQIMDLGDMLYGWPFVGLNPPRKLAPVIARVDGVEMSWAECKKLLRTGDIKGKKVELTGALMRE